MSQNPWDLMRELASMQDRMNRIWHSVHDRGAGHEDVTGTGRWLPPVDIYENDEREIVLRADLPGLRREAIDLTVENNTLTIRGERVRDDEGAGEDRYHRVERPAGTFQRTFTLPNTVDAGRVRAEYRDGVLTMTLPLREEARPRQIQVDVSDR
jgi:HSP20 family protein